MVTRKFAHKNRLRVLSLVLVFSFLVSEFGRFLPSEAMASQQAKMGWEAIALNPSRLILSPQWAELREVRRGAPDAPLLVHIQDAHANISGQENIARLLDDVFTRYGVIPVLVEGGTKDNSLTAIKSTATKPAWKKAARKFLLEGKIAGEEYLNLTSEHPMKILGVEDLSAYQKGLEAYSNLTHIRGEALGRVKRLRAAAAVVKRSVYPKELRELDEACGGNLQIGECARLLMETRTQSLGRLALPKRARPNLELFARVLEKEKVVDFDAARLEQAEVFERLGSSLAESIKKNLWVKAASTSGVADRSGTFDLLVEEAARAGIPMDRYPALQSYRDYLGLFKAIQFERFFDEMADAVDQRFEGADKLTRDLRAVDRRLELLEKAQEIRLSSNEYAELTNPEKFLSETAIEAFINRRLADRGSFRDLIAASDRLTRAAPMVDSFYRSAEERDESFIRNTEKWLALETAARRGPKAAILIAGGYHTEGLVRRFREKGWSYVVASPRVTSETVQEKYERVLLEPLTKGKVRYLSSGASRGSGPKLEARSGIVAAKISEEMAGARMAELIHEAQAYSEAGARLVRNQPWKENREHIAQHLIPGINGTLKVFAKEMKFSDPQSLLIERAKAVKLAVLASLIPATHVVLWLEEHYHISEKIRSFFSSGARLAAAPLSPALEAVDLKDLVVISFSSYYESQGGLSVYLERLNRAILSRYPITIVQVYFPLSETNFKRRPWDVEEFEQGSLVHFPIQASFRNAFQDGSKRHRAVDSKVHQIERMLWLPIKNAIRRWKYSPELLPWVAQLPFIGPRAAAIQDRTQKFEKALKEIRAHYPGRPILFVDHSAAGWEEGRLHADSARRLGLPAGFLHHGWAERELNDMKRLAKISLPGTVMPLPEKAALEVGNVEWLGNAVDTSEFKQEASRKGIFRKFYKISDQSPIVLVPARVERLKGQMDLLQSFSGGDADQLRNITFVFAGEVQIPDYRRQIEEWIQSSHFQARVIFTGNLEKKQMLEAYEDSDVVVLPSYTEAMPNVLLEGQAMGKPVVATNVGGVSHILLHGQTGSLVSLGDAPALSGAVLDLIRDSQKRERWGRSARHYVEENHSLDAWSRTHVGFLKKILSSNSGARLAEADPSPMFVQEAALGRDVQLVRDLAQLGIQLSDLAWILSFQRTLGRPRAFSEGPLISPRPALPEQLKRISADFRTNFPRLAAARGGQPVVLYLFGVGDHPAEALRLINELRALSISREFPSAVRIHLVDHSEERLRKAREVLAEQLSGFSADFSNRVAVQTHTGNIYDQDSLRKIADSLPEGEREADYIFARHLTYVNEHIRSLEDLAAVAARYRKNREDELSKPHLHTLIAPYVAHKNILSLFGRPASGKVPGTRLVVEPTASIFRFWSIIYFLMPGTRTIGDGQYGMMEYIDRNRLEQLGPIEFSRVAQSGRGARLTQTENPFERIALLPANDFERDAVLQRVLVEPRAHRRYFTEASLKTLLEILLRKDFEGHDSAPFYYRAARLIPLFYEYNPRSFSESNLKLALKVHEEIEGFSGGSLFQYFVQAHQGLPADDFRFNQASLDWLSKILEPEQVSIENFFAVMIGQEGHEKVLLRWAQAIGGYPVQYRYAIAARFLLYHGFHDPAGNERRPEDEAVDWSLAEQIAPIVLEGLRSPANENIRQLSRLALARSWLSYLEGSARLQQQIVEHGPRAILDWLEVLDKEDAELPVPLSTLLVYLDRRSIRQPKNGSFVDFFEKPAQYPNELKQLAIYYQTVPPSVRPRGYRRVIERVQGLQNYAEKTGPTSQKVSVSLNPVLRAVLSYGFVAHPIVQYSLLAYGLYRINRALFRVIYQRVQADWKALTSDEPLAKDRLGPPGGSDGARLTYSDKAPVYENFVLISFSSLYEAAGGLHTHLESLNRALLARYPITIIQMYPASRVEYRRRVPWEAERIGLGQVIYLPIQGVYVNPFRGWPVNEKWIRPFFKNPLIHATQYFPFLGAKAKQLLERSKLFDKAMSEIVERFKDKPMVFMDHGPRWPDAFLHMDTAERLGIPKSFLNHGRIDPAWTELAELEKVAKPAVLYSPETGSNDFLGQAMVVGTGVDTAKLNLGSARSGLFRDWFGIDADTPIVLVPARIEPAKGQLDLLRAFAPQRRWEDPNPFFVFAGNIQSSKYRDEIDDFASAAGLSDRVRFVGDLNDEQMRQAYEDADIVVLPSHSEGVSRVILEAGALGKPVVVTDVGGSSSAVLPGQTGFVVPLGDLPALRRAVQDVLSNSTMRQKMGQRARDFVQGKFSMEAWSARVMKFYISLLEDRGEARLKAIDKRVRELISTLQEFDSDYTSAHLARGTLWASKIIEGLKRRGVGISHWDERIALSAMRLHDIGKMDTPSEILFKPEKLTEDEMAIMKRHAEDGERRLFEAGLPELALIVRAHQEFYDGRGYPDGLKGEEIPLASRVIAAADALDSMISDRPYRKALAPEKIVSEFKSQRGKQFDPIIVDVLLEDLLPNDTKFASLKASAGSRLSKREGITWTRYNAIQIARELSVTLDSDWVASSEYTRYVIGRRKLSENEPNNIDPKELALYFADGPQGTKAYHGHLYQEDPLEDYDNAMSRYGGPIERQGFIVLVDPNSRKILDQNIYLESADLEDSHGFVDLRLIPIKGLGWYKKIKIRNAIQRAVNRQKRFWDAAALPAHHVLGHAASQGEDLWEIFEKSKLAPDVKSVAEHGLSFKLVEQREKQAQVLAASEVIGALRGRQEAGARLSAGRIDPGRIYGANPGLENAAHFFNTRIQPNEIIPALSWPDVVRFFELVRGDGQNPYYVRREQGLRLSGESDAGVGDLLEKANKVFPVDTDHAVIAQSAADLYLAMVRASGTPARQFFEDRKGFGSVLERTRAGRIVNFHPSNGHHRTAYYVMNHFIARNGFEPFYFQSRLEYAALMYLDIFVKPLGRKLFGHMILNRLENTSGARLASLSRREIWTLARAATAAYFLAQLPAAAQDAAIQPASAAPDIFGRLLDRSRISADLYRLLQFSGLNRNVSYDDFQKEPLSAEHLAKLRRGLALIQKHDPEIGQKIMPAIGHILILDVRFPGIAVKKIGNSVIFGQSFIDRSTDDREIAEVLGHEGLHATQRAARSRADVLENEIDARIQTRNLVRGLFGESSDTYANHVFELDQAQLDRKGWVARFISGDPEIFRELDGTRTSSEAIYRALRRLAGEAKGIEGKSPVLILDVFRASSAQAGTKPENETKLAVKYRAGGDRVHHADIDLEGNILNDSWVAGGRLSSSRTDKALRRIDAWYTRAMRDRGNFSIRQWTMEVIQEQLRSSAAQIAGAVRHPKKVFWSGVLRHLDELKREGRGFLIYAVIIEILEDIVAPAFFIAIGMPGMAAIFVLGHSEPVTWPIYFFLRKFFRGRLPEHEYLAYFTQAESEMRAQATLEGRWRFGVNLKKRFSIGDVLRYFSESLEQGDSGEISTLEKAGFRETSVKTLGRLMRRSKAGTPSSLDEKKALEVLVDHIHDRDPWVRKTVAGAFGKILDPSSVSILEKMLNDPDPSVRGAAARSLGAFGWNARSAVDELMKACQTDANPNVRAYSAIALGLIADKLLTNKKKMVHQFLKERLSLSPGNRAEFLSVYEALSRLGLDDEGFDRTLVSGASQTIDPTVAMISLWGLARRSELRRGSSQPFSFRGIFEKALRSPNSKARAFSHSILKYRFGFSETQLRAIESSKRLEGAKNIRFVSVEPGTATETLDVESTSNALTIPLRRFRLARSEIPAHEGDEPAGPGNLDSQAVKMKLSMLGRGASIQIPLLDLERGKLIRDEVALPKETIILVGTPQEIENAKRALIAQEAPDSEEYSLPSLGLGRAASQRWEVLGNSASIFYFYQFFSALGSFIFRYAYDRLQDSMLVMAIAWIFTTLFYSLWYAVQWHHSSGDSARRFFNYEGAKRTAWYGLSVIGGVAFQISLFQAIRTVDPITISFVLLLGPWLTRLAGRVFFNEANPDKRQALGNRLLVASALTKIASSWIAGGHALSLGAAGLPYLIGVGWTLLGSFSTAANWTFQMALKQDKSAAPEGAVSYDPAPDKRKMTLVLHWANSILAGLLLFSYRTPESISQAMNGPLHIGFWVAALVVVYSIAMLPFRIKHMEAAHRQTLGESAMASYFSQPSHVAWNVIGLTAVAVFGLLGYTFKAGNLPFYPLSVGDGLSLIIGAAGVWHKLISEEKARAITGSLKNALGIAGGAMQSAALEDQDEEEGGEEGGAGKGARLAAQNRLLDLITYPSIRLSSTTVAGLVAEKITLNEQGRRFFWELTSGKIIADYKGPGAARVKNFDELFEEGAVLLRLPSVSNPEGEVLGVIAQGKNAAVFLDFGDIRQSAQDPVGPARAYQLALDYSKQVLGKPLFDSLRLDFEEKDLSYINDQLVFSSSPLVPEYLNVLTVRRVVPSGIRSSVLLSIDNQASAPWQELLEDIYLSDGQFYQNKKIGVIGSGAGIDALLALVFGAAEVWATDNRISHTILAELNVARLRELGIISRETKVVIEFKEGLPSEKDLDVLLFNSMMIDAGVSKDLSNPDPMKNSFYMSSAEFMGLFESLRKFVQVDKQRRVVFRLQLQRGSGLADPELEHEDRARAFLSQYPDLRAWLLKGLFFMISSAPNSGGRSGARLSEDLNWLVGQMQRLKFEAVLSSDSGYLYGPRSEDWASGTLFPGPAINWPRALEIMKIISDSYVRMPADLRRFMEGPSVSFSDSMLSSEREFDQRGILYLYDQKWRRPRVSIRSLKRLDEIIENGVVGRPEEREQLVRWFAKTQIWHELGHLAEASGLVRLQRPEEVDDVYAPKEMAADYYRAQFMDSDQLLEAAASVLVPVHDHLMELKERLGNPSAGDNARVRALLHFTAVRLGYVQALLSVKSKSVHFPGFMKTYYEPLEIERLDFLNQAHQRGLVRDVDAVSLDPIHWESRFGEVAKRLQIVSGSRLALETAERDDIFESWIRPSEDLDRLFTRDSIRIVRKEKEHLWVLFTLPSESRGVSKFIVAMGTRPGRETEIKYLVLRPRRTLGGKAAADLIVNIAYWLKQNGFQLSNSPIHGDDSDIERSRSFFEKTMNPFGRNGQDVVTIAPPDEGSRAIRKVQMNLMSLDDGKAPNRAGARLSDQHSEAAGEFDLKKYERFVSYGDRVYVAIGPDGQKKAVLKFPFTQRYGSNAERVLWREVQMMEYLRRHPAKFSEMIPLFGGPNAIGSSDSEYLESRGVRVEPGTMFFIQKYEPNNVGEKLLGVRLISEVEARRDLTRIFRAFSRWHHRGIYHRDLSANQVFLTERRVVVSDLELAASHDLRAPELLQDKGLKKLAIDSFGNSQLQRGSPSTSAERDVRGLLSIAYQYSRRLPRDSSLERKLNRVYFYPEKELRVQSLKQVNAAALSRWMRRLDPDDRYYPERDQETLRLKGSRLSDKGESSAPHPAHASLADVSAWTDLPDLIPLGLFAQRAGVDESELAVQSQERNGTMVIRVRHVNQSKTIASLGIKLSSSLRVARSDRPPLPGELKALLWNAASTAEFFQAEGKFDFNGVSYLGLNPRFEISQIYADPDLGPDAKLVWYRDYILPFLLAKGVEIVSVRGSCLDNLEDYQFWRSMGFSEKFQINFVTHPEFAAFYIVAKRIGGAQPTRDAVYAGWVEAYKTISVRETNEEPFLEIMNQISGHFSGGPDSAVQFLRHTYSAVFRSRRLDADSEKALSALTLYLLQKAPLRRSAKLSAFDPAELQMLRELVEVHNMRPDTLVKLSLGSLFAVSLTSAQGDERQFTFLSNEIKYLPPHDRIVAAAVRFFLVVAHLSSGSSDSSADYKILLDDIRDLKQGLESGDFSPDDRRLAERALLRLAAYVLPQSQGGFKDPLIEWESQDVLSEVETFASDLQSVRAWKQAWEKQFGDMPLRARIDEKLADLIKEDPLLMGFAMSFYPQSRDKLFSGDRLKNYPGKLENLLYDVEDPERNEVWLDLLNNNTIHRFFSERAGSSFRYSLYDASLAYQRFDEAVSGSGARLTEVKAAAADSWDRDNRSGRIETIRHQLGGMVGAGLSIASLTQAYADYFEGYPIRMRDGSVAFMEIKKPFGSEYGVLGLNFKQGDQIIGEASLILDAPSDSPATIQMTGIWSVETDYQNQGIVSSLLRAIRQSRPAPITIRFIGSIENLPSLVRLNSFLPEDEQGPVSDLLHKYAGASGAKFFDQPGQDAQRSLDKRRLTNNFIRAWSNRPLIRPDLESRWREIKNAHIHAHFSDRHMISVSNHGIRIISELTPDSFPAGARLTRGPAKWAAEFAVDPAAIVHDVLPQILLDWAPQNSGARLAMAGSGGIAMMGFARTPAAWSVTYFSVLGAPLSVEVVPMDALQGNRVNRVVTDRIPEAAPLHGESEDVNRQVREENRQVRVYEAETSKVTDRLAGLARLDLNRLDQPGSNITPAFASSIQILVNELRAFRKDARYAGVQYEFIGDGARLSLAMDLGLKEFQATPAQIRGALRRVEWTDAALAREGIGYVSMDYAREGFVQPIRPILRHTFYLLAIQNIPGDAHPFTVDHVSPRVVQELERLSGYPTTAKLERRHVFSFSQGIVDKDVIEIAKQFTIRSQVQLLGARLAEYTQQVLALGTSA